MWPGPHIAVCMCGPGRCTDTELSWLAEIISCESFSDVDHKGWNKGCRPHIGWLGEVLGVTSFKTIDTKGWTIFHHLYRACTSSELALNIACNMADPQMLATRPVYGDTRPPRALLPCRPAPRARCSCTGAGRGRPAPPCSVFLHGGRGGELKAYPCGARRC